MQFSQQPKGAVVPKKQKKQPKKSGGKKKAEQQAAATGPATPASESGRTTGMGPHVVKGPPPKKTGKRGIGPALDPVDDFDTPVHIDVTVNAEKNEPVQGELIQEPKAPPPKAIQNGRIAMHFVGYKAKKTKDREKIVTMDFSLELTEEHKKRLPREIEDAWHECETNLYFSVEPDGMGEQNLVFFLAADDDEPALEVVTSMDSAVISRISERGKGKERKITRLTLRFITDLTDDVDHFCVTAFDETVYATMEETQRRLGDK